MTPTVAALAGGQEAFVGFVLVFLGAGIGGSVRHGVNIVALRTLGTSFPFSTLAVNIVGSLAMGIVAEYWAIKSGLPQPLRLFLTTGILGGFTTFSAFSLDTALLWERGQPGAAFGYAISSVVLSVGALFCGLWIVRIFTSGAGT